MTITVKKLGGSVAVVIPKAMAREMELVEGTSLEIDATPDRIVLRKSSRRPRRPLSEIVKQIKPASYHRHRTLVGGEAVGEEPW